MKGQALIEIILALAIAVAVITGITFAVTSSLTNATFTKNQNLATTYAQQGMETVRTIRDAIPWSGPSGFHALLDGWKCLPQNSTELKNRIGLDCEGPGEGEIIVGGAKFIREIRFQINSSDCNLTVENTKVTVDVKWVDSKCPSIPPSNYCHKVELVSCFTNSNVVPIP